MFLNLDPRTELARHEAVCDRTSPAVRPPARAGDRPGDPDLTLGGLLEEVGRALAGAVDGTTAAPPGPAQDRAVQAVLAALLALGPPELATSLAPRDGEPAIVALRSLAVLSQRTAGHRIPVPTARAVAVRDLLHRLGPPSCEPPQPPAPVINRSDRPPPGPAPRRRPRPGG